MSGSYMLLIAGIGLLLFSPSTGQFLSLRLLTNSTAQAERCIDATTSNAAFACSEYCNFSGQNGTSLYNYFCSAANRTCGVTSYCYNAPLLFGQTVVPTLTANATSVTVPCGLSGSAIGLLFNLTGAGNQTSLINQQVVASTPSDNTTGYLAVFPLTGKVILGTNGPAVDTTQTIAFTAYQRGSAVYSNTVLVSVTFKSCALQISCTSQYASSKNPNTPCFNYNLNLLNGQYPQLTCTITNIPAGLPVIWDQPGDFGTSIATLNSATNCQSAPLVACTAYAPLILNGTDALTGNQVNIVNLNAQPLVVPGVQQYGPTGVYGPNPESLNYAAGCQYLEISAVPATPQAVPFVAGTKIVEVCAAPDDMTNVCGTTG